MRHAVNEFAFVRRNHNVRNILKGISLGSKDLNFCDASNHFHHLFFFGDLNYRIDELDSVVRDCTCITVLQCCIMRYWHQRADERIGIPPPKWDQEPLFVCLLGV